MYAFMHEYFWMIINNNLIQLYLENLQSWTSGYNSHNKH